MTWALMPVRNQPERTIAAIDDLLAQSVPTKILLVAQGVDEALRDLLEKTAEGNPDRIFLWSFNPALPALAAVWNCGLDRIWESGASEALVVNNDVRLHRDTVRLLSEGCESLQALFVSAVGVREEQFDPCVEHGPVNGGQFDTRGGPDFSCFLLKKDGHQKYRFDESFVPAFCEDLDTHRRYLLGGDGSRIFSINLPYLHYASQTLKTMSPEERQKVEAQIQSNSRAYYERKWGGPVNQETFLEPFGPDQSAHATTPYLQETRS